MSDKCDSTHDGNGRPGSGIMFSAAEKLLRAVSVLMDTCGECGVDSSRALAAVKRRENQLIDASARHDAKVSALRERLSAANAKLAEMARLAEDSAKAANELVGSPWRTDEFGDEGVVLLWDGECAVSAELGPGFYDTSKSRNFGNPTHWMPLPQPPKEADDDDA